LEISPVENWRRGVFMLASGSPQRLARQAVIVDGCNTPYHLPVLKRIIKREITAKAGTLFCWD
jgi:hypothetical protein